MMTSPLSRAAANLERGWNICADPTYVAIKVLGRRPPRFTGHKKRLTFSVPSKVEGGFVEVRRGPDDGRLPNPPLLREVRIELADLAAGLIATRTIQSSLLRCADKLSIRKPPKVRPGFVKVRSRPCNSGFIAPTILCKIGTRKKGGSYAFTDIVRASHISLRAVAAQLPCQKCIVLSAFPAAEAIVSTPAPFSVAPALATLNPSPCGTAHRIPPRWLNPNVTG
jgi:hypothetical protein